MNVDWGRLRAVVIESDDWGLCAWVPDEQAHRALADSPAWRTPAGRIYGRSTLESAEDVSRLVEVLLEFRGHDGWPPVWQANTIMGAPDYERLEPPLFACADLPLIPLPSTPSRWHRPGLWDQVRQAVDTGTWWPELHGLHHLPAEAWLGALRRGAVDARRAHAHQCLVCEAAEASGEYDPSEPADRRTRNLEAAVEQFRSLFGRAPSSLCPPDYRWDEHLEDDAARLGIGILQGRGEQVRPLARFRRLLHLWRWPEARGPCFSMPARVSFEPRGAADSRARLGARGVHAAVRQAWSRGQPAVVSTHRVNYAHLDPAWSEAGRVALRDLLHRLVSDGATFWTDAEVQQNLDRGWSARPIARRGAILRCHGADQAQVRVDAPPGTKHALVREGGSSRAEFRIEGGEVIGSMGRGDLLLEWAP